MSDWKSMIVRHEGTDTEFSLGEAVILGAFYEDKRDLPRVLTAFEEDLSRTERDLDELSRRHREEHAVVQKFLNKVKAKLADNDALVIEDWDDFNSEFGDFDGFDLDRPRRDWSANVKLTVILSVSGESDVNLDEDDIDSLICDSIGFGDIRVSASFCHDNCETTDSAVEDYDIDSVEVEFND